MKMAWSPRWLLCSLHMHSVPGALYVCAHRISPRRNAGRDYHLRVADGETEAGVQYFRPAGKCGAGACPHSVVSGDTASLLGFAVAPGSHSTSPAGGIRGSGISDGCACAGKRWGRPQSLDRGLRLRYWAPGRQHYRNRVPPSTIRPPRGHGSRGEGLWHTQAISSYSGLPIPF